MPKPFEIWDGKFRNAFISVIMNGVFANDFYICLGLGSNLGNKEDNLIKALKLIKDLAFEHNGPGFLSCVHIACASPLYLSSPVGNEKSNTDMAGGPFFLNCIVVLALTVVFSDGRDNRGQVGIRAAGAGLAGLGVIGGIGGAGVWTEEVSSFAVRFLHYLKNIEKSMGRKEERKRYMPRIIDIDMLFIFDKNRNEFATVNLPELKLPHAEIFNRKFVLKPLLDLSYPFNFRAPFDKESIKKALAELENETAGASQKIFYYGEFDKNLTQILRQR